MFNMRAESGGSTGPFLALGNCRTNFFNIFTFILTLGILLLCVQGGELTGEAVKGMCAEKRAFYRIVSGLHTSITVHLCRKYLLQVLSLFYRIVSGLHTSITVHLCRKYLLQVLSLFYRIVSFLA